MQVRHALVRPCGTSLYHRVETDERMERRCEPILAPKTHGVDELAHACWRYDAGETMLHQQLGMQMYMIEQKIQRLGHLQSTYTEWLSLQCGRHLCPVLCCPAPWRCGSAADKLRHATTAALRMTQAVRAHL